MDISDVVGIAEKIKIVEGKIQVAQAKAKLFNSREGLYSFNSGCFFVYLCFFLFQFPCILLMASFLLLPSNVISLFNAPKNHNDNENFVI